MLQNIKFKIDTVRIKLKVQSMELQAWLETVSLVKLSPCGPAVCLAARAVDNSVHPFALVVIVNNCEFSSLLWLRSFVLLVVWHVHYDALMIFFIEA